MCTLTQEIAILANNKQNFKTVTSICLRNAIFNNDPRLTKHEVEIPIVSISIDSLATHAVRHVFVVSLIHCLYMAPKLIE